MLGLQDILSNKQTRGAFGEIQLREIVTRALPPDAVAFQATLSNGTRADCLIHLPNPPGPIVIDAKFPLEAYEALRAAKTPAETQAAQRLMRGAVRAHMKAIAEKYVIEGETAEGALMFLPSEAVYAELHANFGDLVREGFGLRVWIVSPTTCMATLHTLRAVLKDARLRAEAHVIRRELGLLHKDAERLAARVGEPRPPLRPGAEGHRGDQDLRRPHPAPRPPHRGDRLLREPARRVGRRRRPAPGGARELASLEGREAITTRPKEVRRLSRPARAQPEPGQRPPARHAEGVTTARRAAASRPPRACRCPSRGWMPGAERRRWRFAPQHRLACRARRAGPSHLSCAQGYSYRRYLI